MNGVWQAMNTANWDLQDHAAAPGPFYQIGAIGAVPPGQTVVEGGDIPYLPAAAEQKKKNYLNRLTEDPEVKCYLPGMPRATYMPYPFQIVQSPKNILFAYEYASANRVVNMDKPTEAPGGQLDGLVERQVGRRYAGRRRQELERQGVARSRRRLS